jgi:hypothetical protein
LSHLEIQLKEGYGHENGLDVNQQENGAKVTESSRKSGVERDVVA